MRKGREGNHNIALFTAAGQHYIVNGQKKWITNGVFADYFTVAVRACARARAHAQIQTHAPALFSLVWLFVCLFVKADHLFARSWISGVVLRVCLRCAAHAPFLESTSALLLLLLLPSPPCCPAVSCLAADAPPRVSCLASRGSRRCARAVRASGASPCFCWRKVRFSPAAPAPAVLPCLPPASCTVCWGNAAFERSVQPQYYPGS